MISLKNINNNSIIVCPNERKDTLVESLSNEDPSLNIKFISKGEVLEGVYFSYDYEALLFTKRYLDVSFALADEVLKNLKTYALIPDPFKNFNNLLSELKEKGLLSQNSLFKNLFNNKKVYIYGYSNLDKEISNALSLIKVEPEYIFDEDRNFSPIVNEYETAQDEIKDTVNKIAKLVDEGVSLNNIFLFIPSEEYRRELLKNITYLNIPISGLTNNKLIYSPIYLRLINLIKEDKSIEEAYDILSEEYNKDKHDALGKIVKILTDVSYLKLNKEELIELLDYVALKTNLKEQRYEEEISIIDQHSVVTDDDHVFMLGFAQNLYPHIHKDNSLFSDVIKNKLNQNTTEIKNQIEENELVEFIKNTRNLTINYSKNFNKTVLFKSTLIEKLNLNVIKTVMDNKRYSYPLSEIELAKIYDIYNFYKIDNPYRLTFEGERTDYKSYSHDFTPIKDFEITNDIKISYSAIDNYNKCPFNYYYSRVLKLNDFEETLGAKIGVFIHRVLKDSIEDNYVFNVDDYKELIDKDFKTKKDKFFLMINLDQIADVLKKNNNFRAQSENKIWRGEEELTLKLDDHTKLIGDVDKFMIDNDNKTIAVVDYKTYDAKIDLRSINFGRGMQLPIYSLLLKEKYPDYRVIGLFLQNVLLKKADRDELGDDAYDLNGVFLNDVNIMTSFDHSLIKDEDGYKKSSYIDKAMLTFDKKTKEEKFSGTFKKKNFLSQETFDANSEATLEKVKEVVENIRNGEFKISATRLKQLEGSLPCDGCPFRSVCYRDIEKDTEIKSFTEEEDDDEL